MNVSKGNHQHETVGMDAASVMDAGPHITPPLLAKRRSCTFFKQPWDAVIPVSYYQDA